MEPRSKILPALLLTLLLSCAHCFAPPVDLDRLEYENARDVTLRILEKFPPDKYFYVGIGRSPTPIVEMLRRLSPRGVKNLPLSNFYARPEKTEGFDARLSPDEEARLFDHFARFLPTEAELAGRKILYLDYVQGGTSAIAGEEYLNKYFREHRPGTQLQVLLLAPEEHLEFVEKAGKHYDVISTGPYKVLHQRFPFFWYKDAAEYGQFPPPFLGSGILQPNHGERRAEFLARYHRFMDSDPAIQRKALSCLQLYPWLYSAAK